MFLNHPHKGIRGPCWRGLLFPGDWIRAQGRCRKDFRAKFRGFRSPSWASATVWMNCIFPQLFVFQTYRKVERITQHITYYVERFMMIVVPHLLHFLLFMFFLSHTHSKCTVNVYIYSTYKSFTYIYEINIKNLLTYIYFFSLPFESKLQSSWHSAPE